MPEYEAKIDNRINRKVHMTKKLNSFILTDDLIAVMKDLLRYTMKSGDEVGFNLCANKTDNIIKMPECAMKGNCHSVTILKGCPEGYYEIGDFHTHPGEQEKLAQNASATDLKNTCEHIGDCVGTGDKIKCYMRRKDVDSYNCKKEFSEFVSSVESPINKIYRDLKDKRPEILKLDERVKFLSKQKRTMNSDIEQRQLERQIIKYNKSLEDYDRKVDKATLQIKELREKYFNEVEL